MEQGGAAGARGCGSISQRPHPSSSEARSRARCCARPSHDERRAGRLQGLAPSALQPSATSTRPATTLLPEHIRPCSDASLSHRAAHSTGSCCSAVGKGRGQQEGAAGHGHAVPWAQVTAPALREGRGWRWAPRLHRTPCFPVRLLQQFPHTGKRLFGSWVSLGMWGHLPLRV